MMKGAARCALVTFIAAITAALWIHPVCVSQPRLVLSGEPAEGKTMTSKWLEKKLSQNDIGFVLFQYRSVPQDELPPGPRAAMSSSRLWQERLMQLAFQVPLDARAKVHDRKQGEPDAISFDYEAGGFSVVSYHLMDRLAIVLTPLPDNTKYAVSRAEPAQVLASRIARAVFQPGGRIDLVTEASDGEVKFGRNRKDRAKAPERESATDLIQWWCEGGTFGYATEKVTVLEEGNVPSTAGFSEQQVYMWFDTFGIRRYR